MNSDDARFRQLAAALPDIPRFIETRATLLAGTAEIYGLTEHGESFVALNPYTRVAVVVGVPETDAILNAVARLERDGDVLAFDDNIDLVSAVLDGWEVTPAVLHLLTDSSRLPVLEPIGVGAPMARPHREPHPVPVPADHWDEEIIVRMLSGDEVEKVEGGDAELMEELRRAVLLGRLAATFVDGRPVSFCHGSVETETLWDIGIDTLEAFRGRGYAALAVAYMIDQQGRRGRRPVWGAEEGNVPSMRLAQKLGFKPIDRLLVLNRLA